MGMIERDKERYNSVLKGVKCLLSFLYLNKKPNFTPFIFFFPILFWPTLAIHQLSLHTTRQHIQMKFCPKTLFAIVILTGGTGALPVSAISGREDHTPGVQAESHTLLAKRQLVPVMHMAGLSAQDYAASHSLSTLNNEGDLPSALEKRSEHQRVDITA